MAKDKEAPVVAKRETQAEIRPTRVRLSELVLQPERYSHRRKIEFSSARLKALKDSIVSEGLQVPIEFYRDAKGRLVVLKGHRRVTALRLLAADNTPGFTPDMEIDALEVINGTADDYLLRSVLDNTNRQSLSRTERMRAARVLNDNGIEPTRAAFALGISVKQYERDLRIARYPWMLQHVEEDSIAATYAARLLEEAEKVDGVAELKEDLDAWIAEKKKVIREKERLRKVQTGKDLRPAEKAVKNLMPRHLVEHWIAQLRKKRRFDEDARWTFAAGIEESGKLRIEALSLDLMNAPLEDLARVAAKLSKLTQDLLPFLESRSLMEAPEGPQARLKDEKPYDLDILRKHGLGDLAVSLEMEIQPEDEPAEEPGYGTEGGAYTVAARGTEPGTTGETGAAS
jgi:ParB-like chromosome segregation protein Spo0J